MTDEEWAKNATNQCIKACVLNLNLARTGLWDKTFMQMKTAAEIEAYDIFLISLNEIKQKTLKIEERLSRLDGH